MVAPEVHGEPADDDRHSAVDTHGDAEEGPVFEFVVRVHGDEDTEAGDGDADGNEGEGETVFELVAEEGYDHREGEGCGPGRDGVQLRLDGGVAVCLDDSGGEEGVPVRGDDESKVHEPADEDLVVFEDVDDVLDADCAFSGGAALVLAQPPSDVGALFFVEPFCVFGEIGDKKEEEEGDDAGEEALEDEDPAPS